MIAEITSYQMTQSKRESRITAGGIHELVNESEVERAGYVYIEIKKEAIRGWSEEEFFERPKRENEKELNHAPVQNLADLLRQKKCYLARCSMQWFPNGVFMHVAGDLYKARNPLSNE